MKRVRLEEMALWHMYQSALFHQNALESAKHLLSIFKKNKCLLFSPNFTDVHPKIYPEHTLRQLIIEGEHEKHDKAVSYVLTKLEKIGASNLPFQLVLNPCCRIEIINSLYHAERRVEKYFNKAFPKGEPDGLSEEWISAIVSIEDRKLRNALRDVASDNSFVDGVRRPAKILLSMLDSGLFTFLEDKMIEIIGEEAEAIFIDEIGDFNWDDIAENAYKIIRRPFATINQEFSDRMHSLEISFYNKLFTITKNTNISARLFSHSHRILEAGDHLSPRHHSPLVVHSVAPLYVGACYGESKDKEYMYEIINAANTSLIPIITQFEKEPIIKELSHIGKNNRDNRLSQGNFTEIDKSLYDRYHAFRECYGYYVDPPIDTDDYSFSEDKNDGVISAEEAKEIYESRKKIIIEGRELIEDVKRKMFSTALNGLFEPKIGGAMDFYDWIASKREHGGYK